MPNRRAAWKLGIVGAQGGAGWPVGSKRRATRAGRAAPAYCTAAALRVSLVGGEMSPSASGADASLAFSEPT